MMVSLVMSDSCSTLTIRATLARLHFTAAVLRTGGPAAPRGRALHRRRLA